MRKCSKPRDSLQKDYKEMEIGNLINDKRDQILNKLYISDDDEEDSDYDREN
jgi:hypothetical protein